MKIEILRCFKNKNDGIVYGEYYITDKDSKCLCFQNGNDIQLLVHWQRKSVKDCITKPTKKVIDAIIKVSREYLSTDLKFESVEIPESEETKL